MSDGNAQMAALAALVALTAQANEDQAVV